MPARILYLAAYDVTDPDRLQAALRVLKGYACGGQKSVFECFLTERERRELVAEVRAVLDLTRDRFLCCPWVRSRCGRWGLRFRRAIRIFITSAEEGKSWGRCIWTGAICACGWTASGW